MDCFHDFCLYCDRDSPDGPYCSQQCKLAELERSSNSNPGSPSLARQSWNPSSSSSHRNGSYHYRQPSTPGYDAPTGHSSRPRSSYFMYHPSPQQQQASDRTIMEKRQLTPSSSRTSLSSTTSSSGAASAGGISNTQAKQLAEYFSSFDAAKAAKRRSSLR